MVQFKDGSYIVLFPDRVDECKILNDINGFEVLTVFPLVRAPGAC